MSKRRSSHYEEWQARLGTKALNPVQVLDMQEALRERKKRAEIDGRWFKFVYHNDGTVYYTPEEGFAPCGYLIIDKFLEEL